MIIEHTARDGEARLSETWSPSVLCALCRFLDAGEYNDSHALDRPASKKRQGTKSLGRAPAVQYTLWGFEHGVMREWLGSGRLRRSY